MRTTFLLFLAAAGALSVSLLPGSRPAAAWHAAAISAGGMHTCLLTTAGGVECWGSNVYGALGNGTQADSAALVPVVGLASDVVAIAAGGGHTCALTEAGGVKCWGNNSFGGLGDGTTTNRTTPVDVVGLEMGAVALSAGYGHSCAVTEQGGVKCWGWNEFGQLGDGTTTNRSAPVDVLEESGGEPIREVIAVAVGDRHTCALTVAGGVKCWGSNFSGQLGDNREVDSLTPVEVAGLGTGVAAITAGAAHTCALTAARHVKCWGNNEAGQLGIGSNDLAPHPSPLDVLDEPGGEILDGIAAVSAQNAVHTCVVTTEGGVKCWGLNFFGQVGDTQRCGATFPYSCLTPVDVPGLESGVAAVSTGALHTCALTTEGNVICRGDDLFHQLGDSDGDGHVNSIDAALILQLDAGLVDSLAHQDAADVNRDSTVNAIDAEFVLQYDAGLIDSLPL